MKQRRRDQKGDVEARVAKAIAEDLGADWKQYVGTARKAIAAFFTDGNGNQCEVKKRPRCGRTL